MEANKKDFIDTFECAKYLSLSVSKVRKLTMSHEIPFYKISRKKCLFKVEELKAWVESMYVPTNRDLSERANKITCNFE